MEFNAIVTKRLVLIARHAIAREISNKIKLTPKIKHILKYKEFDSINEYLCARLYQSESIMLDLLTGVAPKSFTDVLGVASSISEMVLNSFTADGMSDIDKVLASSLRFIIFEDLINLQNAYTRFRYFLLGESHREYKQFLSTINIKHPDDF